jgi:hypothetical protein
MYSSNDSDVNEYTDPTNERQLILDGTVYMDEPEDISVPRVKGLVELISDYFNN